MEKGRTRRRWVQVISSGAGKDRCLHEPHSMGVLGILDQEVPEWLWAATSMRGKKCGVESLSGGFFAWIAERLGRRWPK